MTKQDAICYILDEMHRFIGVTPPKDKSEYSKPDWYEWHKWTVKQQTEFEMKMSDEIYKNTKLRKALGFPKSKNLILREIKNLMLYCGWGFRKEDKNGKKEV